MSAPAQARSRLPLVELATVTLLGVGLYVELGGHFQHQLDAFLAGRRKDLYTAAVSLHTALLGFVLATFTIVVGYAQSDRFTLLRESRWYRALLATFLEGLRARYPPCAGVDRPRPGNDAARCFPCCAHPVRGTSSGSDHLDVSETWSRGLTSSARPPCTHAPEGRWSSAWDSR